MINLGIIGAGRIGIPEKQCMAMIREWKYSAQKEFSFCVISPVNFCMLYQNS